MVDAPGGRNDSLSIVLPEMPLDADGRWRNLADTVGRLEAVDVAGLWLADHILWHSPAVDALSTIPALALVAKKPTTTIGSGVLQLPLRDPITVAKTFANAAMMAPGRVVCGVGIGENVEEYERLGHSMRTRGAEMDLRIDELRRLWDLRGGTRWMNPEPPAIPLWVGGRSEPARRRAAAKGDAWLPYLCSPRWFERQNARLDEDAVAAGRDPAAITRAVVVFVDVDEVQSECQGLDKLQHLFGFDPEPLAPFLFTGPADEVAERLQAFRAAGAQEIQAVVANDRCVEAFEVLNPAFQAASAAS